MRKKRSRTAAHLWKNKDKRAKSNEDGNTEILCTYGGEQPKKSLVLCKSDNGETSHDKRKTDK